MADDAPFARGLLDDLAHVRAHARRARGADWLAAALAAVLSLGGAAVFLASTQITAAACHATATGRSCSAETVEFNGWAYWLIGGAVAAAVVAAVRHLRGVRRAAPSRIGVGLLSLVLAAAVAALFVGYEVAGLGGGNQPWLFPAIVTATVALLAARRRDRLALVACAAASAAIITVAMRVELAYGPSWWFERNAGLALCATAATMVTGGVAFRWYQKDAA